MNAPKDPSIPIRLPSDLLAEIDAVSVRTGLSKQDIMRLCMRIGLVDLSAAEHDLPGIVKKIADDKGVSFQTFAKAQTRKPQEATGKRFELKQIIGPKDLQLTDEEKRASHVNEDQGQQGRGETAEDRLNAAIERAKPTRRGKSKGEQKAG